MDGGAFKVGAFVMIDTLGPELYTLASLAEQVQDRKHLPTSPLGAHGVHGCKGFQLSFMRCWWGRFARDFIAASSLPQPLHNQYPCHYRC